MIQPPAIRSADHVHMDAIINRLDPQTSGGVSGWTTLHTQLCYGIPAENTPYRRFLLLLSEQMRMGTAPAKILLTSARLTPLQQTPEKIRPIAGGEILYRTAVRFGMKVAGPPGDQLLPTQLGVGSPGGVEPLVQLITELYERSLENPEEEVFIAQIDIKNAFNNVSRKVIADQFRQPQCKQLYQLLKWAYNDPAPLILQSGNKVSIMASTEGVKQGCPSSTYAFSKAIRSKLEQLSAALRGELHNIVVAYLDDATIATTNPDILTRIVAIFSGQDAEAPTDGLILNVAKTKVISMANITAGQGLPILGSMVGPRACRSAFLRQKTDKLRWEVGRLRYLPYQQALTLHRLCLAPELLYLLRSMDTVDLADELYEIDDIIHQEADRLSGIDSDQARPPQQTSKIRAIYNLPSSYGGIGLPSYVATRPAARAAALDEGRIQLRNMGVPDLNNAARRADPEAVPKPPTQRERMQTIHKATVENLLEVMSVDEASSFQDNASKCGSAWLSATPHGNFRKLEDYQVIAALRMRTQHLSVHGDPLCLRCRAPLTIAHAERCRLGPHVEQGRHNHIRDHILQAIRAANPHQTFQSETPVNNQQQQVIRPRRSDIRVCDVAGGNGPHGTYHHCDLKVKNILAMDAAAERARARGVHLAAIFEEQYEHFGEPAALQGNNSAQSEARRDIAVALDFAHAACIASYEAVQLPQRIYPLVISSGGTMHKGMIQFIKELIPDKKSRRQLIIDISFSLIRARATAFVLC